MCLMIIPYLFKLSISVCWYILINQSFNFEKKNYEKYILTSQLMVYGISHISVFLFVL